MYLDYLKNEYLQLNVKNAWVDISQRKIYQWPISTKKYSTSLIIMEMQIKSQWAITTHPLDWLKLTLTTPNVSENMELSVLSYIAYKNVKMGHRPDWFDRFLKTALLKYNLQIIKFIHFKCAVQWVLVNGYNHETTNIIIISISLTPIYIVSPFLLPSA